MAGHCRRYANLQADKTGDCEAQCGVCLSAATGGVFGEVRVGVFEKNNHWDALGNRAFCFASSAKLAELGSEKLNGIN